MFRRRLVLLWGCAVLSSLLICGCGRPALKSVWRDRPVVVDGKYDEWEGALSYYDEKNRVSAGAINDGTYLYLCLVSRNAVLPEQMMRKGFIVWFDPKGDTDKSFGIRFPYGGMMDKSVPWGSVEVLCPNLQGSGYMPVTVTEKDGILVKTGNSGGYFVYELQVPLVKDDRHAYALGANVRTPLGVGFDASGELPGKKGVKGGSDRLPGGGGPGGRPGGPVGPEGMSEEEKGMQLWVVVLLSSGGER